MSRICMMWMIPVCIWVTDKHVDRYVDGLHDIQGELCHNNLEE